MTLRRGGGQSCFRWGVTETSLNLSDSNSPHFSKQNSQAYPKERVTTCSWGAGKATLSRTGTLLLCLSDPTEIPTPIARQVEQYPCRTVFPVVSQTLAATPPFLSVKMTYRSPRQT